MMPIKKTVLMIAALEDEVQGLLERAGAKVVYTGIGKVNAAYRLTQAICEGRAKGEPIHFVVNVGTAGSAKFPTHSLVECSQFFQRDMDLRPLGFKIGETPYDSIGGEVVFEKRFADLPRALCGSGDSFETQGTLVECDVVDMEAFALAKICKLENIEFTSVKYISDGSDHNSHNDWAANLPKAAAAFEDLYRQSISDAFC